MTSSGQAFRPRNPRASGETMGRGCGVLLVASAMTVCITSSGWSGKARRRLKSCLTGRSEMEDSPAFRLTAIRSRSNRRTQYRRERRTLYLHDWRGEAPPTSNPRDCCPAWSPDARSHFFSARGGLSSLWRIRPTAELEAAFEGVGTPATSPAIARWRSARQQRPEGRSLEDSPSPMPGMPSDRLN
jgi:hypothetical protein